MKLKVSFHYDINESLTLNIDMKASMRSSYRREINHLKVSHIEAMIALKLSFTVQIEDLQLTLSDATSAITQLQEEKEEHGTKFIRIFESGKEKYNK
jgi:hypothetical protein